jgi:hypothetical protein
MRHDTSLLPGMFGFSTKRTFTAHTFGPCRADDQRQPQRSVGRQRAALCYHSRRIRVTLSRISSLRAL